MRDLRNNYFGVLVDSHITDHDPSFLSRLSPEDFVQRMNQTGADSVMVYAFCHNGNCYYPTKVGYQHPGLKGRDHFGETVTLLREAGIIPRAYCTVVYHRRVAREHPEWRVTHVDGAQNYRRSWYCCPNAIGYREYVGKLIEEICTFDIDAIFIDMTFWPGICVCHNCRSRFFAESEKEIPQTVDWNDPAWVLFQRSRERWLSEFAHALTAAARETKPSIAIAHQFSPVLMGSMYGQSGDLARAMDVPSGDFYGGRGQQRYGCKVLAAYEKELPFEYMTSRCVMLYDHTSTKSDAELSRSYATTLANAGTHLLIDAINPDGSLEQRYYDRVEKIAKSIEPFRAKLAELRPKLVADVALYHSMPSHVRRDHNGQSLRTIINPVNNMLTLTDLKPVQEVINAASVLNRAKIPYRVITDTTTDYGDLRSIILNDAAFMSLAEVERIRKFVDGGGTLLATGSSSYYDLNGNTSGDFALKDVFGVSFTGKFSRHWNYLVSEQGEMVSNDVPGPLVSATTAKVLARVAEPMFDRDDLERFASYHSNPPAAPGPHAALTVNRFGKGHCVYLYSSIFSKPQESQQAFCEQLVREHTPSALINFCNAPSCVEATVLRGTTRPAWLVCLVNYQEEPANVPVTDIAIAITLPEGAAATSCKSVATGQRVPVERDGGQLSFRIPRLDTIEMIEIATQEDAS